MPREPAKPLHPEFQEYIDRQAYSVVMDGLRLTIDSDVFPPDMGKCAQNLAKLSRTYQPQVALDMGSGSGYLALMLKRNGTPRVWASDIHGPAVACAKGNVRRNAWVGPVEVVQGDLFAAIPASVKFDLILFNQPFGPAQGAPVCGCGPDGGYEITRRFLTEAPSHLNQGGAILMAFSDREPVENSPECVANELGYPVVTVLHEYYSESNNFIYEIRPR